MRNLSALFYGIVYGIAHVIPGLSGGTFLVIFGCYDTVCQAFALNFKEIKKNLIFLIFFGIGSLLGLIGFAHVITFLMASFEIQTNLFFMGLILGGLPLIIKITAEGEKFKPSCIPPFALGFALVASLFFMEKLGAFEASAAQGVDTVFFLKIALYSFTAAIAMVLPGISGAFILLAFGVYDMFMEALKGFDFAVIIPAAIGIFLGIVLGAKLVLLLLNKFKLTVYSAIIGMVAGSVIPLFPHGLGLNAATAVGVVCFAAGVFVALMFGKGEG